MKEHSDTPPNAEDARKLSMAVDEYIARIRELGSGYGTLLAASAPGDACLVGCQMAEGSDPSMTLQLVTVIVSWLAAQLHWSEEDARRFTDLVADHVCQHIRNRAAAHESSE